MRAEGARVMAKQQTADLDELARQVNALHEKALDSLRRELAQEIARHGRDATREATAALLAQDGLSREEADATARRLTDGRDPGREDMGRFESAYVGFLLHLPPDRAFHRLHHLQQGDPRGP
jgi:hypothetical protein